MRRSVWLSVMLAVAFGPGFSGCQIFSKPLKSVPPPPPPQNYFSQEEGIAMRRVAMLPAFSEKYPSEYLNDVDTVFAQELTKKSVFEVIPVSRPAMEAMFGKRQLSSVEALPSDLLNRLQERYQIDGVLLMDVTHYSPYRPLALGVRCKLIDISNGEIRWAFDYIFDTGNPTVAQAVRTYQVRYSNEQQPLPTDGGTALISPTRFAKFVANQTYSSLQRK